MNRRVLETAMGRAIELAGTPGVPHGPNPRVGCVILSPTGETVGEGFHQGIGTAHAEIVALASAGSLACGATAVVTLEPCRHEGRTGPCTQAIIAAGVARVVYAQPDPNPVAGGGASELVAAGIEVEGELLVAEARALNQEWSIAVARQRPFVTLKLAGTLDGRVAAKNGTSRWITGIESRGEVHELRSQVDAVVVGTGTVLADDPDLSDRRDGHLGHQPLRVVIGERDLPPTAKVRSSTPSAMHLRTRDLTLALERLYAADVRHVLVEGGPTLATAFLREGLVDRLRWYVAPVLLGSGKNAVSDLGIESISDALRWTVTDVIRVGSDVRIDLIPPVDPLSQEV